MNNVIFLLFLTFCFLSLKANAQNAPLLAASSPALIELFTSQGCSSCPPAENLLNTWGMELFKAKKALPLAFHVDYWDYLGWKDPFSSSLASDRQRSYGAFFQSNTIYTPQMIVQGQVGFNGADQNRAQKEIDQAQLSPLPGLELSARKSTDALQVKVAIPTALAQHLNDNTVLYVALFENDLQTSVGRGENSGSLLKENFVVRSLKAISYGEFKRISSGKLTLNDPGAKSLRAGVAAWFQDPQTMKIQGLQWVYPLSNS